MRMARRSEMERVGLKMRQGTSAGRRRAGVRPNRTGGGAYAVIGLCLFVLGFGDPIVARNRKGNEHYAKEEHNDALEAYQNALVEDPDSPRLHFNVGNVLYRAQQYGDAVEQYRKGLDARDPAFLKNVHYNMGNAQFQQGQWSEALESYKETLKLDPNDVEAKFNLELTQVKLREQDQQRQQQDELGKKDQQTPEEQQERRQGQEQKPVPQQQEEGEEEQQDAGEPLEQKMSQEDAQRVLDALKEEEKKAQRNRRVVPKMGGVYVEKEW